MQDHSKAGMTWRGLLQNSLQWGKEWSVLGETSFLTTAKEVIAMGHSLQGSVMEFLLGGPLASTYLYSKIFCNPLIAEGSVHFDVFKRQTSLL